MVVNQSVLELAELNLRFFSGCRKHCKCNHKINYKKRKFRCFTLFFYFYGVFKIKKY